jgi:hypothetical protein
LHSMARPTPGRRRFQAALSSGCVTSLYGLRRFSWAGLPGKCRERPQVAGTSPTPRRCTQTACRHGRIAALLVWHTALAQNFMMRLSSRFSRHWACRSGSRRIREVAISVEPSLVRTSRRAGMKGLAFFATTCHISFRDLQDCMLQWFKNDVSRAIMGYGYDCSPVTRLPARFVVTVPNAAVAPSSVASGKVTEREVIRCAIYDAQRWYRPL